MKNSTKTPKILARYEADIINFFVTVKRWSQVLSTIAEKQPKIIVMISLRHVNTTIRIFLEDISKFRHSPHGYSIFPSSCNFWLQQHQPCEPIREPNSNPSAIWLDSTALALTTWCCRNLAKQHHTLNRTWIKVGFMTLGQRSGVVLCKQQSFHFLTIYTGRYAPKVYPLVFHSDFAFQHLRKDTWDTSCHDITQCHRDVISTRCELTTALEWLLFSSTVCSWGTRKSQDARPRWLISIQEDTQS